jgi:branched-chain amino acid transport system permease protein
MPYFLRRLYKNFEGEILAVPGKTVLFFVLLALFCIGFIPIGPYFLKILIFTTIFTIYAASWDLLYFAGQLNLGQGAFFGVSGYMTAILDLKLHLPGGAAIILGAMSSVMSGFILGIPALRMRGPYLAILTLAFPVILTGVVFAFSDITGGELGLSGISSLSESDISVYYICLVVMLLSVLIMWKLTDTRSSIVRTGIVFKAIAEDEIAARTSGINTPRYKLLAFAMSAFFSGISGGLYVYVMKVAGPTMLHPLFSLYPVIWTIFGGAASIYGAIVGVFILYPFWGVLFAATPELRMVIYTALIIVIILFMPEGISHWFRDRTEKMCPRCKLINSRRRSLCRACSASL